MSQPDKAPTHLWEGGLDSVRKRRPTYENELPQLIQDGISDEEITIMGDSWVDAWLPITEENKVIVCAQTYVATILSPDNPSYLQLPVILLKQ